VALLLETTDGGGELEGPEEVVGLLEVGSDGPDLVDEILNAADAVFAELSVNDTVVGKGDTGAVDLAVTTSVDKLADGGAGGMSVGNKGLNVADHVHGGLVDAHEDSVVELAETEQLHDLLLLGGELVDTAGTDNESNLGLGLNEERTVLLGSALVVNQFLVGSGVLGGVLLGVGEGSGALGLVGGSSGGTLGLESGEELGITSTLLDDHLGNNGNLG